MNILLAFIAFDIIIIVHELGHFIAAKKMGIKVLEFSLFIGPKLFSFTRGETTYSLRLIPVIAYVKMEGEEEASDSDRAFNNKSRSARALVAFSGPFANLLLAVIMLTVVFSIQGFATTKITGVEENSPAAAIGLREGDQITRYEGKRVYMTLDVIQFLYVSKGVPAELEYISDGVKYVKTITPLIIPAAEAYRIGASFSGDSGADSNVVQAVTGGFPAYEAGIEAGDRIISANGKKVDNRNDLVSIIEESKANEISITIMRDGKEMSFKLTPKLDKTTEQYDLGLGFSAEKGNILESAGHSFVYTYSMVRSTVYSVAWLVSGKVQLNQMMGPIGMVSTIGTVVEQGPDLMT
ncbi:MAG: RIP metalloprotease RseP, partial [Clostridiales bacterium]|nr:RIP metalloprotease RseP [Clostridiales bacterium]